MKFGRSRLGAFAATLLLPVAVATTPASAATFWFEKVPTVVKGAGEAAHKLDLAGGTLSCEQVSFEGQANLNTLEVLVLKPSYGGCTMFEFKATVSMHGCLYLIRSNGELAIEGEESFRCSLEPMTIDVRHPLLGTECHIKLKSQTGLKGLTFTNIGTGSSREITMGVSIEGIAYEAEGALCKETGTKANGRYTSGNTLLTAEPKRIDGGDVVGMTRPAAWRER
jgi:hypothetical protein